MSDFVKPFHLSPFEENINLRANRNWDEHISYTNNRNNGTTAFDAIRWSAYACRVYNNTTISVVNGSPQALTFNSTSYDTYNMHSTSVDTSKVFARRSGIYVISGNIEYANNTTGNRIALLQVDGGRFIAISSTLALGGIYSTTCNVSTQYYLNTNQYVELVAIQTSGGSLNLLDNIDRSIVLTMTYVGE